MSQLTYKEAGVDVAAGDAFAERVGGLARASHTKGVVHHPSRYAALFRPELAGLDDPLIAATCDGVGTKLSVAKEAGSFRGLGQDLVAMNVNDLLPLGARPLLFLDYIATGKLEMAALEEVVAGISVACQSVGCALVGGETAEMPGLYAAGDFDLAGFAVGLVDGARLPTPENMAPGDVVLALPASGIHSNGLSLARAALFERGGLSLHQAPALLGGKSIADTLLTPTALYVNEVLQLTEAFRIRAAAHITGGGLVGRGKKLLPEGLRLMLDAASFSVPPIFRLIQEAGGVTSAEMARTFNMGLGFLLVLAPEDADAALTRFSHLGFVRAGSIVAGERGLEWGDVTG